MREELPDFSRLPEDSARHLHRFGIGALVLLVTFLLLSIVYAIGEKMDGFRWHTFRNGLFSFGMITLGACIAIITITAGIRGMAWLWPEAMQRFRERRQLKKAKREVAEAISEKHRLSEERARLTAQLKATFLYEKETTDAANAKASKEFQEALQSSVLRSCQIAFQQITKLVDQYELVVAEIESSALPPAEKTELLNSLTKHLDVAAVEERNKDAQKLMEAEIWKVRFRKARLMARDKSTAAISYLEQIAPEARSSKMKSRIAAMIESLRKNDALTQDVG